MFTRRKFGEIIILGIAMLLTRNFSQNEMECRCGCGLASMNSNFMEKLQLLRDKCNFPLKVTSGMRCKKWNEKAGGHKNSSHMKGLACDLAVDGLRARIVIQKALEMGFDGVGISQGGSKFVHVDLKPREHGKAVWTYS